jgi:prepilin-type N-terminal cleavage/methylation domain-containing protein
MKQLFHKRSGFTLIELLVVVAILAIFAAVVYAALNPQQRLKDAANSKRGQDVDNILTAVHEYIVDQKGSLPATFPAAGNTWQIGTANTNALLTTMGAGCTSNLTATGCTTTAGTGAASGTGGGNHCYDLAGAVPAYLKSNPYDPKTGASVSATGYFIGLDTNNIVTVTACNAQGTTISVSR